MLDFKKAGRFLWHAGDEFFRDGCPQMAASISFYTLFSLPPLVVLLIMVAEPFLDPVTVRGFLQDEAVAMIGPQAADQLAAVVENVSRPGQGGPIAAILGVAAFLFGATAAFAQLQGALNAAWEVAPNPDRGDVANFLTKRILSFGMILGIGVLLLASVILSVLLSAFGATLEYIAPGIPSGFILQSLDTVLSFSVIAVLFAAMYRYLPDAIVDWNSALMGGFVTALLFSLGKFVIGYYLGSSDPGSAFGAAGSLAMVLIWIYYSSMMLLMGAEITQVWMKRGGRIVIPSPGAVRVITETERYDAETGLAINDEGESVP